MTSRRTALTDGEHGDVGVVRSQRRHDRQRWHGALTVGDDDADARVTLALGARTCRRRERLERHLVQRQVRARAAALSIQQRHQRTL